MVETMTKRATFLIPDRLHREFKKYAIERGETMTDILISYIRELVGYQDEENREGQKGPTDK